MGIINEVSENSETTYGNLKPFSLFEEGGHLYIKLESAGLSEANEEEEELSFVDLRIDGGYIEQPFEDDDLVTVIKHGIDLVIR